MWCDNCLLIFPLRAGAIAWAVFIAVYSFAGSLFLLEDGQYLFFIYPEWYIYGGIGMGVCAISCITAVALSNRSYIWSRCVGFMWPFLILACSIRAIFMIWELYRGRNNIVWECENGGELWPGSAESGYGNSASFPGGFCAPGWSTLYTIWIVSLIFDIAAQMYMFFLNWRFMKRLEHYRTLKGPQMGYYSA